jgi:hypothetical protein
MLPECDTPTGSQLDEHHAPETNGRMAVCRRCGSRTDGPAGRQHMPAERQMTRIGEWLTAESKRAHIKQVRDGRER